jgi:hydroxymethylpyrimidine pyrophosphatase-like HAD family hydrolase
MGNGDQKLKDASDLVVKNIDEDGVADAIENYILK